MNRDRNSAGRPRNARPRDALGRPLERSADGSGPTDEPALTPPEALDVAQRLLDSGHAFAAHEVLEAVWKSTSGPERALWRGLAQLAVGLTHRGRGNEVGAQALLARGADTLASVEGSPWRVPVAELRTWAAAAAADHTGPMPRLTDQAADERS
jgi:uncharacterized protein